MGESIFLANVNARKGATAFDESVQALSDAGLNLAQSQAFQNYYEFRAAVATAVEKKADIVIIGGGDGTLGSISGLLSNSDSTLAVIPLGTGNQFAREIGIPNSIVEAAEIIKTRAIARVDVACLNGQNFLTVATIGISATIARNLKGKGAIGKFAYAPGLAKALARKEAFRVSMESSARKIASAAIQIVVSNGKTHAGPFWASPDATVTDGLLDVYIIAPQGGFKLIKATLLALSGKHIEMGSVTAIRADHLTLSTQPKKSVIVDGEELWFDEMNFSVDPAALKVIVGPNFRCPEDRIEAE